MYFNTLEYFAFFALAFLATRRIPHAGGMLLLLASIAFYLVAGWFDTALIGTLITSNWLLLRFVKNSRARVAAAICINIGVLAAVKYRVLLIGGLTPVGASFSDVVLPLGVSFYTFQLLAYQVDTARDESLLEPRIDRFSLFFLFFPQLIAGPIVRAREMLPQIQRLFDRQPRRLRLANYALGLIVLGLVKKVVFADSLAPVVDEIFVLGPTSSPQAWLGALCFAFQIYFDFSGYCDIAIGCAYLLGIRLPHNFRTPYLSRSPREFWQRWHITLSTWIRDYLYIPLGGAHGSRYRQLLILLAVMGIAGLWHGANATFIAWGVLWGCYIGLHRIAAKVIGDSASLQRLVDTTFAKALLYLSHCAIIVCLWVFFRAESFTSALDYIGVMFSFPVSIPENFATMLLSSIGLFIAHYCESVRPKRFSGLNLRVWNTTFIYGLLIGLALCLVLLPAYSTNPFIYFRF